MKTKEQVYEESIKADATEAEAKGAAELFELIGSALKIRRPSGRVVTAHGSKTMLGLYRMLWDYIYHTPFKDSKGRTLSKGDRIQAGPTYGTCKVTSITVHCLSLENVLTGEKFAFLADDFRPDEWDSITY